MRVRVLLLVSVVLVVVLAGSFVHLAIAGIEPSPGVPLGTIKDRVQKAVDYLERLVRDHGIYKVISSYPGIPVVVYDSGYGWWVPGLAYGGWNVLKTELSPLGVEAASTYSEYKWDMKLIYKYVCAIDASGLPIYCDTEKGVVRVIEHRELGNTYVRLEVLNADSDIQDAQIYFAGTSVGQLVPGTVYVIHFSALETIPSMRTAVRHEDGFGAVVLSMVLGQLDFDYVRDFANLIEDNLLGLHDYDIYNPMLSGVPGFFATVGPPSSDHFYDAKWFGSKLGYDIIFDEFEDRGWVWTAYPTYPYESQVVRAARVNFVATGTRVDGGTLFLLALSSSGDPLYDLWWGLYYAHNAIYGNPSYWDDALDVWNNKVLPAWDGYGLESGATAEGYSTVRLALAVSLGSMLAGHGRISWSTVDDMAYVLVYHLQWGEWDYYYDRDAGAVKYVYKPDHRGGFVTSYKYVEGYGLVAAPYRSGIVEWFSGLAGLPMDPEYGSFIPTNAETTIVAVAALIQYAYCRYGVLPGELLG